MSAPSATEELLKMYETQTNDAAGSASRRAAKEVTDRYAEVTDRVKSANDALTAELSTIHQQLMAEVSAAMNSPLVERCKRTYRAMLTAYSHQVAAATSGAADSSSELESATRRAADAYARATADLTAELVRQLPAAYERYLTSAVNASMDADLTGLVAAANEELLDVMTRAYQPGSATDEQGNGDGDRTAGDAAEAPGDHGATAGDPVSDVTREWGAGFDDAGGAGGGDWGTGTTDADEALWASARTDSWGTDSDDDGWATAATPTVADAGAALDGETDEFGDSPWGPVGSGFADVVLPEDDVGLAPWGSSGVFGSQVADAGGSAEGAGEEANDEPSGTPATTPMAVTSTDSQSAAKKSTDNQSTAKKSAPNKSTAKKSTAKKSTAKKSAAKKKSTAKKSTAEKSAAKKKSTAKKSTAKKSAAKTSTAETSSGGEDSSRSDQAGD